MADIRQTVCDNGPCGAVKTDTNHWWIVWITGPHLVILPWKPGFVSKHLDLCGESCVMAVVSQYLSGKLAMPTVGTTQEQPGWKIAQEVLNEKVQEFEKSTRGHG